MSIGPNIGPRIGPQSIVVGSEGTAVLSTTLTLSLADSADPTPAGNNFDITAVVTNTGSNTATSVSLAVTYDASFTFVSASGTGWTCNNSAGVVTCTRASLAVGAAPTVTITVTAGNSAVSASTSGTVSASNASAAVDSESTTVARPTWTATLNDSADPVINGKNFNITFDLTNNGAGTINNASVTIALDANLTWVSTSGGTGWSLGHSGQNVTATKASFAVGSIQQIVVTVTAAQSSTVSASTSVTCTADNAANATDTETTQLNFIARDATSGIYVPASATEWTNFRSYNSLSAANPNSLWLCQESSGNIADSIGSLTLNASSTPLYQQTVTGWSRKAVGMDSANDCFRQLAGTGPDISTTSQTWLTIFFIPSAPAGARDIIGSGNCTCQIDSSGRGAIKVISTSTFGTTNITNTVTPFAFKYDRTGGTAKVFNSSDKVTGTYNSGTTDGQKGIGQCVGAGSSSFGNHLYACMWSGANAEMTDANLKSLLQAMGFTIGWS